MSATLWHPKARRITLESPGAFTRGGPKLVWHSTEGMSLDAAVRAYREHGGPHFTLGLAQSSGARILVQHIPINLAASALRHPAGTPETNHAHAIQVEVLEFAARAQHWDPKLYRFMQLLGVWIERHAGVPRVAHHPFPGQPGYHRLSPQGWIRTEGHVGHCHCPNNDHVDPGNIRIGRIV